MLYIPRSLRECSKCHIWLPWHAFHVNKMYADGLTRQCRKCRSKAVMRNHKDSPDVVNKAQRKYNRTQKARERYKRYYDSHPGLSKIKNQRMRERNPDYGRDYYRRNPGKAKASFHRRAARKHSLPNTLTELNWQDCLEYFHNCCAVCGRPQGFWHTLAMDHWIPLVSADCPGTVRVNIVPLCHGVDGCNNRKGDQDPLKWLVKQFGARKAKQILKRIQDYFKWVENQP